MKAQVQSIFLERAEGPSELCGRPQTLNTFQAADVFLRLWANTAPKSGGYDKCDFRVTFANGDTYAGRFDLTRDHARGSKLLQRHMHDALTFYAGQRCPEHMTRERYQAYLAQSGDDVTEARKMLETCDLGL